jgi:LmbE family N-acetylglucosaminyl deacetylase
MMPRIEFRSAAPVHRAVIVSPHWDDAVFSCGGRIAQWAREGPVLVINLFTDFTGAPSRTRASLGEHRAREEAAAAAFLGFTTVSLGEKDCVCRSRKYLAPGRLFGGVRVAEDPIDPSRLREKLERVLSKLSWREMVLPLGVGWHVDHLLAHEATRGFHGDPRTLFYEDAPYSYVPPLVERRLAELGHRPVGDGARVLREDGRRAAATLFDWAPFSGLRSDWIRRGARWATGLFFARLFRRRTRPFLSRPWTVHAADISDAFDLKRRACFLYESQIKAFFSEGSLWESHARSVPDPAGRPGLLERYWRLVVPEGGVERGGVVTPDGLAVDHGDGDAPAGIEGF